MYWWIDDKTTTELEATIRQKRCGGCYHWMKKSCPKEKSSMTGYSKGPSNGVPACKEFEDSWSRQLIKEELTMRKLHENL